MTADREQIRRDRLDRVSDRLAHNLRAYGKAWTGEDEDTEFIVQPLLDELEQADRELTVRRSEGMGRLHSALTDEVSQRQRAEAAEARLAKVPALVEALRELTEASEATARYPSSKRCLEILGEAEKAAEAALKTWGGSMTEIIKWIGNNTSGHFEVDGVPTEFPLNAEIDEITTRLTGRTISAIQEWMDGYAIRLDDGQVIDISGIWHNDGTAGTGISFWNQT